MIPLDHLGTHLGAGAVASAQHAVQGVVDAAATVATSSSMSMHAGLVALGFVIGLCAEMRKSD
ncbi:MAG TPA: hypothetical protein VH328_06215 [Burkholderiaceae bacterium]|nr:hypothetical protein [Burkholderiaceae bacterium]